MLHNPELVALGSAPSSFKEISNYPGDPTTFKAGLAVRLGSSGIQLGSSGARLLGVSLGEDLSDSKRIAVATSGSEVPVALRFAFATRTIGQLTFTAREHGTIGNNIAVALVDNQTGNVAVPSTILVPPFVGISIGIDAGVTTNATVKAAVEANEEVSSYITVTIAEGQESATVSAQSSLPLTGGANVGTPGSLVIFDNTTGQAAATGTTSKAVYLKNGLTGTYLDGTTVDVALICMPRGL